MEAEIISLTHEMAEKQIHQAWWKDESLKERFDDPQPIDRHWNWNQISIEFEGRALASEKIAIVAGDDEAVQGAMMISSEPVSSGLERGKGCLFIELLFTAPRNRPKLRKDGQVFLLGSGIELLTWGAWFSVQMGQNGHLRLDGSPDHLDWYEKRGLQRLNLDPIFYEGVYYTPMELSAHNARKLLAKWH